MVIVRCADDFTASSQHWRDEEVLGGLSERFAKFALELKAEKISQRGVDRPVKPRKSMSLASFQLPRSDRSFLMPTLSWRYATAL
jgi:hypothetical protein